MRCNMKIKHKYEKSNKGDSDNYPQFKNFREALALVDRSLSIFDIDVARYALEWIFDHMSVEQAKESFVGDNWAECLKWIHIFNFTGLASSPPGTSARAFYECLSIYVFQNAPAEVLNILPPFILACSGKWGGEKND